MTEDHLVRMIRAEVAEAPDAVRMRYKADGAWRPITGREMIAYVDRLASWLIDQGIAPRDRVAICAPNSPWWSIADLAIMSAGAVTVPIYTTNTPAQAAHIVSDAGATAAFVGGAEQYAKLAGVHGPEGPIRQVVVFDTALALEAPDSCHLATPLAHPVSPKVAERLAAASLDDVATIIYTSGSTGEPKGVILTFANFVNQFETVDRFFRVSSRDRSLSFLPLAHVYERTWSYYGLLKGVENHYLEDPKQVLDAMRDVRPTCMVSVPRLYEKIHATALHRVSEGSAAKRRLFNWAIDVGGRVAHARTHGGRPGLGLLAQHALADRLVLRKIRDIVGGPKNFLSAGGAALSAKIEEFFLASGLLICQGYGLTETAPMLTCNRPDDFKFGTVGKPIPGCAIRIAPDGEILARGPNVTRGYLNLPRETAEAFDEDGWFRTGDVGEFDEDGFLRITDRKKDLIITSGGKNVAPSRIETVIGQDYYIEQVAAIGEGRHYLSALIVPHFEALEAWARERGLTFDSFRSMVKDARVVAFIAERIERQQAVLAHHERVKKFTLLAEHFSQMGGELTPSLKNVRAAIAAKYAQVINAMYGSEAEGAEEQS